MILKSRFFSEIFKIIKCLLVIRPIYLERVAAIFLTPKVYCLLTESGELISKVKGLSHDVELTLEDF
jgi:hypothetical protein